jgi:hypothetical protein
MELAGLEPSTFVVYGSGAHDDARRLVTDGLGYLPRI